MDISTPTVSPLRQRMLEDMRMRKFEPKTQSSYLRAVSNLAAFLKTSPDAASAEDLRRFQMHMVEQGTSPITLNATISGLKFFFDVTLDRGELMAKMQPVRVPLTLPVVLSRLEVSRLLAAAGNLKHQTALEVTPNFRTLSMMRTERSPTWVERHGRRTRRSFASRSWSCTRRAGGSGIYRWSLAARSSRSRLG
jgi:site-specific recombinase XerD